MLCAALFACQSSSATIPSRTSTNAEAPPELKQWASRALADSTPSGISVGRPNTLICSGIAAPFSARSLEIYFDQPVVPSEAYIHAVAKLSAETRVQLIELEGGVYEVDLALGVFGEDCPFTYDLQLDGYDGPVIGLRISAGGDYLENWNAVDAVELVGLPSGSPVDLSTILPTPQPTLALTKTPVPSPTPTPAPIGERETRDRTDDYIGLYQLHVVYSLFNEDRDRKRDLDGSIARSIKLANKWLKEQTSGSSLRFDTYKGDLDITFVQFDLTAKEALETYRAQYEADHVKYNLVIEDYYMNYIVEELYDRGLYQPGKYYIIYLERQHPNLCGYSLISSIAGVFFLGTQDCGYGRLGVDAYAWGTEFVLLHEVLHGIGFSPLCAPHNITDSPHHVSDSGIDLMYPYAGANQQNVLDVGNDDYYEHENKGCPDLADSAFLDPLPVNPQAPADWPREYLLPNH